MTPLSGKPGVVEVQPTDHRADVEGGLNRVQFIRGSRYASATGHHCARDNRAHELRAGGVLQCLKAARERINQTIASGLIRLVAGYLEALRIVSDGDQRGIRSRAFG